MQITIVLGAAVPEQRAHQGWSEGLAVLGTALIVVFIGAGQDYSKERQFQKLNALKDNIEVKVTRGGKQVCVGKRFDCGEQAEQREQGLGAQPAPRERSPLPGRL